MSIFKKITAFCMCFVGLHTYGQSIKSYLIVKAFKYSVANVVIKSSQTLDIGAGNSKIIPV